MSTDLSGKPQVTHDMLFGSGQRMADVQDLVERAAGTDVTVLIRGESGTGKESVARALHAASLRRDRPFVKVNCTVPPTELLEAELFGFERGPFTGAIERQPGKFELANHGTMLLYEIGDTSVPLQARLLQALQDGEFWSFSGKHDVHIDVRVVAATTTDLEQAVADGRFREDLFLRLNIVSIQMPPLRERREDIPMLLDYFLSKYSLEYKKPSIDVSPDTMRLLMDDDWPGNIRELETSIKRTVVLGTEETLRQSAGSSRQGAVGSQQSSVGSQQSSVGSQQSSVISPQSSVGPRSPMTPAAIASAAAEAGNYSLKDISRTAAREAERELIFKVLQRTHWNRKETAEILGISYKALLYKIKENGLDKAS